ncbi:L,D-transpeptidase family protein [Verrucomicrobiales bacterium]|nr:L,D-transpeptidase family protein [Verrucomicrobiales bacterium]
MGSTCLADSSTSQIVTVVTSDWDDSTGTLNAFEFSGNQWKRVFSDIPVTVGRKGLGWGLGKFTPEFDGPEKREGDKKAPAGIFEIESAFGREENPTLHIPYRRSSPSEVWVDDPKSRFYNQRVDPAARVRKWEPAQEWDSAEVLLRKDGLYDLVLVVGHNRTPPVAGRGSAIFMHRWSRPGAATIGCTAMSIENLRLLAAWLEHEKAPILIQVPLAFVGKMAMPDAVRSLLSGE